MAGYVKGDVDRVDASYGVDTEGPGFDYGQLIGLGASLAPALLRPSGGENPYTSPQMTQALAAQQRRLTQSQPAFDAMVNMAFGMTPNRYRTGGAPTFGQQAPAPQVVSAIPRSAMSSQSMAPVMGGNATTSGGGNGWKKAGSMALAGIQPLLNMFKNKNKAKDTSARPSAGSAAPEFSAAPSIGPYDERAEYAARQQTNQPTPSVTTDYEMKSVQVGTDAYGQPILAIEMPGYDGLYRDDAGNWYDFNGQLIAAASGG